MQVVLQHLTLVLQQFLQLRHSVTINDEYNSEFVVT